LRSHVPRVPAALAHSADALPLQPCLCDIWHDHVLFQDDGVSGVIDYGAVKQDHVAVDLARLLGSLVGDNTELWTVGLRAYRTMRPLSEQEERLAWALDRTGTVIALGTWLRWIYREKRSWTDEDAVAGRVKELVGRVERW
jgi:Ser/Thr protein kinase RdoA (MazF antagonist)